VPPAGAACASGCFEATRACGRSGSGGLVARESIDAPAEQAVGDEPEEPQVTRDKKISSTQHEQRPYTAFAQPVVGGDSSAATTGEGVRHRQAIPGGVRHGRRRRQVTKHLRQRSAPPSDPPHGSCWARWPRRDAAAGFGWTMKIVV